jgi:hypothetical protein
MAAITERDTLTTPERKLCTNALRLLHQEVAEGKTLIGDDGQPLSIHAAKSKVMDLVAKIMGMTPR